MPRSARFLVLAGVCLLAAAGPAAGQEIEPDFSCALVTTGATVPVSLYTLPDGAGAPLAHAAASPAAGQTVPVDATITLVLLTCDGQLVAHYPVEDMWLATSLGGLKFCPGGTIADAPTDLAGRTTFTRAIGGGGYTNPLSGERCGVIVSGMPLPPALDIQFNSPDLNGDLRVNLSDTVLYTGDLLAAGYRYRSDFHRDGQLNLSDTVLFARGLGRDCP